MEFVIALQGKSSIIDKVNMLLGQNLKPGSVFVIGDCKCEKLQPEIHASDCIKPLNAFLHSQSPTKNWSRF